MKPTIAVDFDGVIHRYSEGWKDGSIYDIPVEDAGAALRSLSRDYRIIIHTTRKNIGNPENPETGTVWDWLRKHNLDCCVDDITNTKPAEAKLFIDDRAIHFSDWDSTIKLIKPALKIFGKSLSFGKKFFIKAKKTDNSQYALFGTQLDLFNQPEGTVKQFGKDDTRKLQTTASGKKRWVDADKESGETPISDLPSGETVKSPSGEAGLVKQTQQPQAKESKEPYEMTLAEYSYDIQKRGIEKDRAYHQKIVDDYDKTRYETGDNPLHEKLRPGEKNRDYHQKYKSAKQYLGMLDDMDAQNIKRLKENKEFLAPDQKAEHKKAVQQALSEGKKVPEEVLKDYPELSKPDKSEVDTKETVSDIAGVRKKEGTGKELPSQKQSQMPEGKLEEKDLEIWEKNYPKANSYVGYGKGIHEVHIDDVFPNLRQNEYEDASGITEREDEPIDVEINPEGGLIIFDGHNRYKAARKKGKKFIKVNITNDELSFLTKSGLSRYYNYLANKAGSSSNSSRTPEDGEQKPQTKTESFKKWFGDWENDPENASKVVDEEGKPLVVYHGTDTNGIANNKFNREFLGSETLSNASDARYGATSLMGFWFNDGAIKTNKSSPYKQYVEVFLSIKNPLYYDSISDIASDLSQIVPKDVEYDEWDNIKTAIDSYVQELEEEGYDGIIVNDEEFGGESYIAFNPSQIKSATGNAGTFDPENPDITKSINNAT